MSKAFIFVILLLIFQNCSFIAKKGYGAKKPQIENEKSITTWLNKHDFPTKEVVTVDTIGFSKFFPLLVAQAALLFESSGKFRAAGFSNGKYCPQGIDLYLSRVDPRQNMFNDLDSFIVLETSTIPPEETNHLGSISNKEFNDLKKSMISTKDTLTINIIEIDKLLYSLNGNKSDAIDLTNFDLILILPFAKFFGDNLQVRALKKYYKAAISNANARFKIVFLNLDKQQWWGKEANDKVNISI